MKMRREVPTPKEVIETEDREGGFEVFLRDNPGLEKLFDEDLFEYEINPETKKIVSHGHEYFNSKRMRSMVRLANQIREALPEITEGNVRLWRGNRKGEMGSNPSFTNSLEGIALPFLGMYDGELSYVDLPESLANESLLTTGVAEGSEFKVAPEVASQARSIHEHATSITPEAIVACVSYLKKDRTFNKEEFSSWLESNSEQWK